MPTANPLSLRPSSIVDVDPVGSIVVNVPDLSIKPKPGRHRARFALEAFLDRMIGIAKTARYSPVHPVALRGARLRLADPRLFSLCEGGLGNRQKKNQAPPLPHGKEEALAVGRLGNRQRCNQVFASAPRQGRSPCCRSPEVLALKFNDLLELCGFGLTRANRKKLSPVFGSKDLIWTDALSRVVVCWRPSSRISPGPVPRIDKLWSRY